jgi:hypothetical protein
MKKINIHIAKLLLFTMVFGIFIACVTVKPPELTEAEKAVVLIDGFGDKQNIEIKRVTEKCKPIGPLQYIAGQYVARKKAVEMRADTVHFYYYDEVRGASVVRFWKCK